MQDAKLKALGEEIESSPRLAGDLEGRVRAALEATGVSAPESFASSDAVLDLIGATLPGWDISLEGTASRNHGHWTCMLRRSRERDNDEVIGIGRGPHLAPALLAALVKVLSFGPKLR